VNSITCWTDEERSTSNYFRALASSNRLSLWRPCKHRRPMLRVSLSQRSNICAICGDVLTQIPKNGRIPKPTSRLRRRAFNAMESRSLGTCSRSERMTRARRNGYRRRRGWWDHRKGPAVRKGQRVKLEGLLLQFHVTNAGTRARRGGSTAWLNSAASSPHERPTEDGGAQRGGGLRGPKPCFASSRVTFDEEPPRSRPKAVQH